MKMKKTITHRSAPKKMLTKGVTRPTKGAKKINDGTCGDKRAYK